MDENFIFLLTISLDFCQCKLQSVKVYLFVSFYKLKYLMGERGSGVGYSGEGGHLAGASE